MFVFP